MADHIFVIGVAGTCADLGLGDGRVAAAGRVSPGDPRVAAALAEAQLVVGGARHLELLRSLLPPATSLMTLAGDVELVLDAIERSPGTVCVLASGDPGFFGIVRPLSARFGPAKVMVFPAPSSVALAFGRLGLNWDDAVVVSAHGRPLRAAAAIASRSAKAAVLVSPEHPPEALGRALLDLHAPHTMAAVCSQLGGADERVAVTDLAGLAAGRWDPLSVVVVTVGDGIARSRSLAWGRPEEHYAHRGGMITKSEVRAAAVAKLDLPSPGPGTLWDVGAGSGSVAVECAGLAPGLEVIAIDRDPAACEQIALNAARHGVAVQVVHGEAPAALAALPDPDRVFLGGGGLGVLDGVMCRLRPDGRIVASFAAVDRAAAAASRLGAMVQVAVNRGRQLPDGGWRLEADNPVYLVWGPQ